VPTISLSLPVAGTTITAGLHSANYGALQTLLNGGLDAANFAGGQILAPSKLTQEGATDGQFLKWVQSSSKWVPSSAASGPTITYATSPPGSPADGDVWIAVDSLTLPTYQWQFRWHSGSSNADKWEFIGGAAAFAEVTTSETTASTTYAALATAGPTFTIPRAGVYTVEIGFRRSDTNGGTVFMSYDIGGTGAVDADSAQFTGSGGQNASVSRAREKSGLAASTTLTAKYRVSANTDSFADRWMRVTPKRVS
jgi:hypothetical protein